MTVHAIGYILNVQMQPNIIYNYNIYIYQVR